MGTFLPVHLPVNAPPIPRSLVLDPPLTDAELEQFCRLNHVARIERTKEELIRMNPPAGMFTSDENAELIAQLRGWRKTHRRGRVCDSNAGFYLPDGSMLGPSPPTCCRKHWRARQAISPPTPITGPALH